MKSKGRIQAIYIDPPYNASATEIAYENTFRHSTWLSLIGDRVHLARELLAPTGVACVTIDDYEFGNLSLLLDEVMGEDHYLATVAIRNNPSGRSTVKGFAINHEYALFYGKNADNSQVGRFFHSEDQIGRYDQTDSEGNLYEWVNLRKSSSGSLRRDRPKQFFPFFYNENKQSLRVPKLSWNEETRQWDTIEEVAVGEIALFPMDESNRERVWNFGIERIQKELEQLTVRKSKGRFEVYARKYLNQSGYLARTWWDDSAYSARDNGTRTLVDLFGPSSKDFEFPKAVRAVQDSLTVCGISSDSISVDYFAGSGTTAHAVINLNREDGGRRKYILVEMGDHFNTVILPRVKKVVFSNNWKDGQARPGEGISHFAKYYDLSLIHIFSR